MRKTNTQHQSILRKSLKFLSLFLIAFTFVSLTSCRSDDDPADNDFFVGTYKGSISYTEGTNTKRSDKGKVVVTKIASGTKYNFAFSDGIPDINDVEFKKHGDNTLVMVGTSGTSYIKIDNKVLDIFYVKDGKMWTANCKR